MSSPVKSIQIRFQNLHSTNPRLIANFTAYLEQPDTPNAVFSLYRFPSAILPAAAASLKIFSLEIRAGNNIVLFERTKALQCGLDFVDCSTTSTLVTETMPTPVSPESPQQIFSGETMVNSADEKKDGTILSSLRTLGHLRELTGKLVGTVYALESAHHELLLSYTGKAGTKLVVKFNITVAESQLGIADSAREISLTMPKFTDTAEIELRGCWNSKLGSSIVCETTPLATNCKSIRDLDATTFAFKPIDFGTAEANVLLTLKNSSVCELQPCLESADMITRISEVGDDLKLAYELVVAFQVENRLYRDQLMSTFHLTGGDPTDTLEVVHNNEPIDFNVNQNTTSKIMSVACCYPAAEFHCISVRFHKILSADADADLCDLPMVTAGGSQTCPVRVHVVPCMGRGSQFKMIVPKGWSEPLAHEKGVSTEMRPGGSMTDISKLVFEDKPCEPQAIERVEYSLQVDVNHDAVSMKLKVEFYATDLVVLDLANWGIPRCSVDGQPRELVVQGHSATLNFHSFRPAHVQAIWINQAAEFTSQQVYYSGQLPSLDHEVKTLLATVSYLPERTSSLHIVDGRGKVMAEIGVSKPLPEVPEDSTDSVELEVSRGLLISECVVFILTFLIAGACLWMGQRIDEGIERAVLPVLPILGAGGEQYTRTSSAGIPGLFVGSSTEKEVQTVVSVVTKVQVQKRTKTETETQIHTVTQTQVVESPSYQDVNTQCEELLEQIKTSDLQLKMYERHVKKLKNEVMGAELW